MHQYGISCNRKSQSGSSDLTGMGFIHPVKSFVNMIQRLLRNTDSGIFYFQVEILVIRIQRYVYPALSVIPVIFDCILHKICDRKRDFYLIHFCGNRAETLKDKFHFLLIRNRLQTF